MKRLLSLIKLDSDDERFSRFLANYARLILVWNPLISAIFLLAFSDFDHPARSFLRSYLIANIVGSFCMLGTYALFTVRQVLVELRGRVPRRPHWGWTAIVANTLVIPGLYFGFAGASALNTLMGWSSSVSTFSDYRQGIFNGLIISSIFFLYRIWDDSREQKRKYELQVKTLENETLKARLAALNYQMNPHLLFNSLNTIASMIPQKPEIAEDMTVQLSDLYRGILVSMKGSSHSLGSELDLVRAYLNIENARFGDRVRFQINVDSKIDADKVKIPVLLVQPLVENAIKHGLSEKSEGGEVRVDIHDDNSNLKIIVSDDGVGFGRSTRKGSGTGIENCRSRLSITYGDRAKFAIGTSERGTRCEILFPTDGGLL